MDLEKDLANQVWKLILEQPFYGFFLAEVNKSFVPENSKTVPTACVAAHRGSCNVQLLLNEKFWTNLNEGERRFILKHEINHIMYEHIYGSWEWLVGAEKMLGNMAMDMFINQNLDYKVNMPKGGMLPDTYPNLKLKWGEGTEYYFKELQKAKEEKAESAKRGENDGKGTSGDKGFDKMLENEPQDWHKEWESITQGMGESEKDMLKKQIQQAIEAAVEETEKSRGEVPAHLKDLVKKALIKKQPIANWRTLFRQFMGKSQLVESYRTRKRENVRFPDSPANRHKFKQKIVFCIDESGSMSERELQEANSELYHVWKAGCAVTIVHWDSQVHHVEEYQGKLECIRHCGGGTMASCAIQWVNEHKNNYDVAIVATDGYIESNPLRSNVPMIWLITSEGNMQFDHHATKLKMNASE